MQRYSQLRQLPSRSVALHLAGDESFSDECECSLVPHDRHVVPAAVVDGGVFLERQEHVWKV